MKNDNSINLTQVRAGRAVLNWSQQKLANAASISISTIRKLEVGKISPRKATLQTLKEALETAGLEFIEPDGVRRKPEGIIIYEGIDGVDAFIGDIRRTLRKRGGDILAVEITNDKYDFNVHRTLVATDQNLKTKCFCSVTPEPHPLKSSLEFRMLPKNHLHALPFYIYGDKYAVITYGLSAPDPRIIVMHSPPTASAARTQFLLLWERATPFRSAEFKLA